MATGSDQTVPETPRKADDEMMTLTENDEPEILPDSPPTSTTTTTTTTPTTTPTMTLKSVQDEFLEALDNVHVTGVSNRGEWICFSIKYSAETCQKAFLLHRDFRSN